MAMIMVGALNVAGIETVWAGNIPDKVNWEIKKWNYRDQASERAVELNRGDEMGRFNMGSTVILLYSNNQINWNDSIVAECPVKMGQQLASTTH